MTSHLIIPILVPRMGIVYDPPYDAGFPPAECRACYVPRITKVLYYLLDDETCTITVFLVGDTRSDPMTVFVGLHLADLE